MSPHTRTAHQRAAFVLYLAQVYEEEFDPENWDHLSKQAVIDQGYEAGRKHQALSDARLLDKETDRCWGILDRLAKTIRGSVGL